MTVGEWAVKFALEIAPDEVELAPLWADRFVQGGAARRELFTQSNSQAAGFLPGESVFLIPLMFKALAAVAAPLAALLASQYTGKLLDIVKNALSLAAAGKQAADLLASRDSTAQQLSSVAERLEVEIRKRVLEEHKRQQIVLAVLYLLLESPQDAKRFLAALTARR